MEKKMYYVTVPNKSFSGKRHGVQFYKGQAMAEFSEKEAKELKNSGYEVEEVNGELNKEAPAEQTPETLETKADEVENKDKKNADVKKANPKK